MPTCYKSGGIIIKKSNFKNQISCLIFLFIAFCIGLSTGLPQTRIMPLGNSITMGRHGEPSGYRDDLAILLLNENVNFNMVGSMNDGSGFYPRHEGHSGWRADEIYTQLNQWLNMNPPDFVLLHIGTNDISQAESNESTIDEIEDILNLIHSKNSNTIILLCSLIPRFDQYQDRPLRTEQLNDLIYELYYYKLNAGFEIYFVDQESAFKENSDWTQNYMDDYVHPNDLGYHIMAETFYQVLINILNPNVYAISGNILYYSNNEPVNNTTVLLSGSQNATRQTGSDGFYKFTNLSGNTNITINPDKVKLDRTENEIINMYDAALTLRHAVGIESLAAENQTAADVDRDGQIIAFDAALIARYAVELPEINNDNVGEWLFSPEKRNYNNLTNNYSNQNFKGYLLGDVCGAWNQTRLNTIPKVATEWITEINANFNESFLIPIKIYEDSLLSCEMEITYPEHVLQFISIECENQNMQFFHNKMKNKIKAGVFIAEPILFYGDIFVLEFMVLNNVSQTEEIVLTKLITNNNRAENSIAKLNVRGINQHFKKIIIGDNYPNPFNPETKIPYRLFASGNVNIRIINILGQEIKLLIDTYHESGHYEIVWDGKDNAGMGVANGLYICKINFDGQIFTKRLIKSE